jgi:glycosyltransferase involved in cell wall biosynthesis
MDNVLDYSIIICAYTLDRWNELAAAVASAQRQTIEARDVIVVVDNNDALLNRASAAFPRVTVVSNLGTPGLGGARNTGASAAQGAVLAFLDDDAVAEDDWLEQLAPGYTDATVLGVGGFIGPIWPKRAPHWFPPEFNWVVGCTYIGMPERVAVVRNLIGTNMSVRADVVEAVGGFDGALGRLDRPGSQVTGTAEETEFCIKASRIFTAGSWLYRPKAVVNHVVSSERTTWRFFMSRCRLEGSSKARLVGLAGSRSGLASERRYVSSTLPLGVLRGMREASRGDFAGAARAGAIVVGLCLTAASYIRGRLTAAATAVAQEPSS